MKKKRIGVIFGGPSTEHDVSLQTGKSLLGAVKKLGHKAIPIKISKTGHWPKYPKPNHATLINVSPTVKIDIALLGLHGTFGEDGRIQAFLDLLGVKYTGCGILASSLAMDKKRFKIFISKLGLHVARDLVVTKPWSPQVIRSAQKKFGWPLVIKPNAQGSSVGIIIAHNLSQAYQGLNKAFRFDSQVLIEEYLGRDEYTVPTLGNSRVSALPVVAIRPTQDEFFSYQVKYDGSTEEIAPAPIKKSLAMELKKTALLIHRELGARGLIRTDFMIHRGRIFVLETNTAPGMTSESLAPKSAAAAGYDYTELVQTLIGLAGG